MLMLLTAGHNLQAQEENPETKTEKYEQKKEQIIAEEKEALKKAVEAINLRLQNQEITSTEAEELKQAAAKKHAMNIENRLAILENEMALKTRNNEDSWENDEEDNGFIWGNKKKHYDHYDRTSSQLVVAFGLNNAIEEGGSLNDLDFKIGGSRFFEIGIAWNTRVFNNTNFLRFKYGFSFQFNGLKPENNQYFVEQGDLTVLEEYPLKLDKSKFRMDNLVIPLHFEFGPSKTIATERGNWYSAEDRFKVGIGGFFGFNLGERQKLKYEENGDDVKLKLKNDYNTNDLVYGLSGYIGWGSTSLYVKYDLNPIFKDPNAELYNISAGVRFDLD